MSEFSLTKKQRTYHKAARIRRGNVLLTQALAARSDAEKETEDRMDEDSDPNEDSDSESEEEESDEEDEGLADKQKGSRRERGSSSSGEDSEAEVANSSEAPAKTKGGVTPRVHQQERIVPPDEIRAHLRLLFKNELPIVTLLYAPHGPLASEASSSRTAAAPKASADMFFMDVVCVPPSRFRPASTMGDQVFENSQNSLLNMILRQTFLVRDRNVAFALACQTTVEEAVVEVGANGRVKPDKNRIYTQLLESLIDLQIAVNSMMDSTKNPMPLRGGKLPPQGVKQLLEKKEGLFRMNMMVRSTSPQTWFSCSDNMRP